MRKIVVLDACVLYSAHLRDFLLYLAQQKLYKPRWSDRNNDEWVRNVLKNRRLLLVKYWIIFEKPDYRTQPIFSKTCYNCTVLLHNYLINCKNVDMELAV